MSSFGKRVDGQTRTRRTVRRQVSVLGSAVTLDGTKSIIIEDICPTGAKLVGRRLPTPGSELLVRTSQFDVLGRIAWAQSDMCGVVLEEPGPNAVQCLAMQLRTYPAAD